MIELIKKKSANLKDDFLSGLTVALALVPEAVAFAFIAEIPPIIGLYGAFMVGLITSIFGSTLLPNSFRSPNSYLSPSSIFIVIMISLLLLDKFTWFDTTRNLTYPRSK